MGLPKGRTNNIKGRPNGHRNKSTITYESFIEFFFSGQLEKLKTEMDKLCGEQYIGAIIRLGKLVNANKEKDYTYVNDVLFPIIKNKLKSKKDENTETS